MRAVELMIPTSGGRQIAMTAFLPELARLSGVVIFASPGGGYGRGYFNMSFEGHEGFSEAGYHASQGHVFIAYDHLGVGQSSVDSLAAMTIEDIADHNHEAVATCEARLRDGTLAPGFPPMSPRIVVGIGQSMGGGVTIIMQARHRSFGAIGVLGYSAIHTVLPQRTEVEMEQGIGAYRFSRETSGASLSLQRSSALVSDFVYPFHWDDVPREILDADMKGGYPIRRTSPPFGSLTIPNCVIAMMAPLYVEAEAAAIDVPVLAAFGERDVSREPRCEVAAYRSARDISIFVVPRMAHMHNFATTRSQLWERLSDWAQMIGRSAAY